MAADSGAKPDDPTHAKVRLAAFVDDLKRLRRSANQPSLRKMSQRSNYSHTALSGALSGNRLPSKELTIAFVRACGGNVDEWRDRWEQENAVLNADGDSPIGPYDESPRYGMKLLAAVGVVLLVVGAGAGVVRWSGRTAEAPPQPAPAAADGSDPQEQRCDVDAVHATTTPVGEPPHGTLTLRFSARCRAAWPLFVSNERVPPGAVIHLETRRPSDGAVTVFDYPFVVAEKVWSVFGNNLRTTSGCLSAAIEVRAPLDQRVLASAETPCTDLSASA